MKAPFGLPAVTQFCVLMKAMPAAWRVARAVFANDQPVMEAERQMPASDTFEKLGEDCLRFSGLAIKSLTASAVKRPREM